MIVKKDQTANKIPECDSYIIKLDKTIQIMLVVHSVCFILMLLSSIFAFYHGDNNRLKYIKKLSKYLYLIAIPLT